MNADFNLPDGADISQINGVQPSRYAIRGGRAFREPDDDEDMNSDFWEPDADRGLDL